MPVQTFSHKGYLQLFVSRYRETRLFGCNQCTYVVFAVTLSSGHIPHMHKLVWGWLCECPQTITWPQLLSHVIFNLLLMGWGGLLAQIVGTAAVLVAGFNVFHASLFLSRCPGWLGDLPRILLQLYDCTNDKNRQFCPVWAPIYANSAIWLYWINTFVLLSSWPVDEELSCLCVCDCERF